MDARLDPNAMTGLEVGDAHIIRFVSNFLLIHSHRRLTSSAEQERRWTSGGCVEELDWVAGRFVCRFRLGNSAKSDGQSFRTALQTREIILIHHEDCGYSHASTPVIQATLKHRTPESAHPLIDALALQEFKEDSKHTSVKEDVEYLRNHPLIHPDSKDKISGWWYSVKNGELKRVC
ncbi:hypothetical protein AAT19DRAFT_16143 [Rhodotorula toruloides]|uniref:Uncharacterized protein n=1 Tax=Rhodotorula toruloides TaxID=5286 RepID=A0A2T0A5Z4_RHOTO|nr:hypothetical protein AAT19DRAFT_16143 [Rhodotorula toruloides]